MQEVPIIYFSDMHTLKEDSYQDYSFLFLCLKGKGRVDYHGQDIAIEKCGFFLPECAYYDYLNNAPDNADKAVLVKKAMEAIEQENPKMQGVLPKEVYGQLVPEEEPELLSRIVRVFKDIPEDISIDLFGQIYEYLLGNFGSILYSCYCRSVYGRGSAAKDG